MGALDLLAILILGSLCNMILLMNGILILIYGYFANLTRTHNIEKIKTQKAIEKQCNNMRLFRIDWIDSRLNH